MRQQVKDALENARVNLDQAIADLDTIPQIDAETLGYTAHKLNNYLSVVGAASELLEVYLAGFPDEQVHVWVESLQHAVQLMKHDVGRLMFSAHGSQVWVDVQADQDHVICTVRDEGKGFSPEDMARLFQKGVRLSNAPTGGEATLGYGLAIAKDIIEKLGGSIWCDSQPGQGASFHVRLPAFHVISKETPLTIVAM